MVESGQEIVHVQITVSAFFLMSVGETERLAIGAASGTWALLPLNVPREKVKS